MAPDLTMLIPSITIQSFLSKYTALSVPISKFDEYSPWDYRFLPKSNSHLKPKSFQMNEYFRIIIKG